VIKVILALEKGVIPPNSENLQNLNPQIDEEFFNLKVDLSFLKTLSAYLTRLNRFLNTPHCGQRMACGGLQ
jgi:hypothetical protein